MARKQYYIYLVLVVLYGIDILYWYGYKNLVDAFIDNSIVWFSIAFVGFCLSYLFNKVGLKHKMIMNILITVGVLLNLFFIGSWYLLKDFGF